jgi:hypothetical protein
VRDAREAKEKRVREEQRAKEEHRREMAAIKAETSKLDAERKRSEVLNTDKPVPPLNTSNKPQPLNTKPGKPSSDRNRDRHSLGYMRDYMRDYMRRRRARG